MDSHMKRQNPVRLDSFSLAVAPIPFSLTQTHDTYHYAGVAPLVQRLKTKVRTRV